MRYEDLFQMLNTLKEIGKVKSSIKFAYGIAKNKKIVQEEVDLIQKIIEPSEELKQFEKDRVKLCEEFADKDDGGQILFVDGSYSIKEKRTEFNEKLKELREKYKELIDEQEEKNEKFMEVLKENMDKELDFYKIKFEYFPDEITPEHLEVLMPLIKEDNIE